MNIFQSTTIQKVSQRRGFALMIAALVASIVLALGASIYDVSIKQLTLSSLSRESQFAFYAADTAAECALYWDSRELYFGTTTPSGITPVCDSATPLAITAYEGTPAVTDYEGVPSGGAETPPYTYPYYEIFNFSPNGYCANVTVTKTQVGAVVSTVIHANGYNTPCASISTSRISLERTVELSY